MTLVADYTCNSYKCRHKHFKITVKGTYNINGLCRLTKVARFDVFLYDCPIYPKFGTMISRTTRYNILSKASL